MHRMTDGKIMASCEEARNSQLSNLSEDLAADIRGENAIAFCRKSKLDDVLYCIAKAKKLVSCGTLEGWGNRHKDIVEENQPIARLCTLAALLELPHYMPQLEVVHLETIGKQHGWSLAADAKASETKACSLCAAPQTNDNKLRRCGCKEAWYCNEKCSKEHWKQHRTEHRDALYGSLEQLTQRKPTQITNLINHMIMYHVRGFFSPGGRKSFKKELSCTTLFEEARCYWRSVLYLYTLHREVSKHLVVQCCPHMHMPMTSPDAPIIKGSVRAVAAIHSGWVTCSLGMFGDDFDDGAYPMTFTEAEVDVVFNEAFSVRFQEQLKTDDAKV